MDTNPVLRLKLLRTHENLTQRQMAGILEVGQNTYSRMENGVTSFKDSYKKILEEKFNLTTGWLSGADVPMIKEEEKQKSKQYTLSSNIGMVHESEWNALTPQKSYTQGVPYYNVDFIGGFDIVLNDQTTTPEYLINFQKYNEATCWCNVTGHSMEPEITHGDIIALKEIEDASFLPYGEVYAIVTTNNMRTIKRIGPASNPDSYSLIPTNRSPEYGIQELPKNMIRHVFHVLGCMKRL